MNKSSQQIYELSTGDILHMRKLKKIKKQQQVKQ